MINSHSVPSGDGDDLSWKVVDGYGPSSFKRTEKKKEESWECVPQHALNGETESQTRHGEQREKTSCIYPRGTDGGNKEVDVEHDWEERPRHSMNIGVEVEQPQHSVHQPLYRIDSTQAL